MNRGATLVAATGACLAILPFLAPAQEKPAPAESVPPAAAVETTEARPLTNVDIVRMVASGVPEEGIIARIESSPGRYDVAPDIVQELRLAGVPAPVIEAMIARSRAAGPAPAPPVPPPARAGWIEVAFDEDPDLPPPANSFAAPAKTADPNAPETTRSTELAFFLICRHGPHVPDHWLAATPLREEIGRHEVLFLHAEVAPAEEGTEAGLVYLPHPPRWRFEAEVGTHAGLIGVAARAQGQERYMPVAVAEYKSLAVEEDRLTRLVVKLRTRIRPPAGRRKGVDEEMHLTHIGTVGRRRGTATTTIEVVSVSEPEPVTPPHS